MFQHTLDRAARLMPPDRIVTVVAQSHRHDALAQLEGRGSRWSFSRSTVTRRPVYSCL
jgi:hypothetical protein